MANPIGVEHNFIEQTLVFPATPRTTTTSLPLTFLDYPFIGPTFVDRLFFYPFSHSTEFFCNATLPSLKHSLSLTLEHFYPLVGNLHCPPPYKKPFILCTQNDSVTFTIIESSADFKHLSTKNHPIILKDLDHLVPKLTQKTTLDDNDIENKTFVFPLLALQASVFPNHGLCIGITYRHMMDANGCNHFMKSWSFIHRRGGGVVELQPPPCFDRDILRDPAGVEDVLSRIYFNDRKTWKDITILPSQTSKEVEEYVKSTIVFGKEEIEGMKKWALNHWERNDDDDDIKAPQFLSKFMVTCGFVWASMIKTMYRNDYNNDEKMEYFNFPSDCRDKLGYSIPEGYFGNCLGFQDAALRRKDMKGEDGFLIAVKVIQKTVTEMRKEPLKDVTEWRAKLQKMSGNTFIVSGSPKFNVYETDFGFGKPVKVEMTHLSRRMSLAESGDKEGGLEVGLTFKNGEFDYFSSLIQQDLKALKL